MKYQSLKIHFKKEDTNYTFNFCYLIITVAFYFTYFSECRVTLIQIQAIASLA